MFDRPHRLLPLPDLRAMAQAHWQDRPFLDAIARELALRPGTAAAHLLGAVQARLRDLPERPSGELERLRQELEEERARSRRAEAEAQRLRRKLEAEQAHRPPPEELARLRRELDAERWKGVQSREEAARLRQWIESRQPGATRAEAAYAELHLASDIPDDLLEALHKAYQKHYHPDRHAAALRDGATERFQAIQRAFEAILRLRGLE